MTEADQSDGERAEGRSSEERTKSPEASPASEARRVFGAGCVDQDATAPPIPPGEVTDRLASLEGRIEEAFAGSGSSARPGGERLRAALDGLLATVAGARRLTVPEPLAALRSFGRPLPIDDPANLSAVVLRALYRHWWRVESTPSGSNACPRPGRCCWRSTAVEPCCPTKP
jgi:hypothetical protein